MDKLEEFTWYMKEQYPVVSMLGAQMAINYGVGDKSGGGELAAQALQDGRPEEATR